MTCVHDAAVSVLDDWVGIAADTSVSRQYGTSDPLYPLVSMFPIDGAVSGVIALSGEGPAVRAIVRSVVAEPISDPQVEELMADALTETFNIIIGRATESLRQRGLPIDIFPPYASPAEQQMIRSRAPADALRIDTTAGGFLLTFSSAGGGNGPSFGSR